VKFLPNKDVCLSKAKAFGKRAKKSTIFEVLFNPAMLTAYVAAIVIWIALFSGEEGIQAAQTDLSTSNSAVVQLSDADSLFFLDSLSRVDSTEESDGRKQLVEKRDYAADENHYRKVVSSALEILSKDSISQDDVEFEIGNIAYQCIFASRLPQPITPYSMVSDYISDPVLRDKIVLLVNNSMFFRQDSSYFDVEGMGHFTFNGDDWHHVKSEAEIRPINWGEVQCLVMGVDYTAPVPRDPSTIVKYVEVVERNIPGYSTVF